MSEENKTIPTTVGQAELVDFPLQEIKDVPARIDTGARTSSVWATDIERSGDEVTFRLFGPASEFYTGDLITTTEFSQTVVASSNGAAEARYKVVLPLRIANKRILAKFTLADRSSQVYPVLIGRNTLRGKFVVDVKSGTVLRRQENARTAELRKLLKEQEDRK